jgi:soluble lytic murein transglycosylase-like protein
MQINSFWAEAIGMRNWLMLGDPCTNVKTGAWILSRCIESHGYTWEAVGCYNARSSEKRARYANRIYRKLIEIGGGR